MSGSRTPESALDVGGDSFTSSREEDAADGIQHSHRMLSFSDALLSIIATVMVREGPHPSQSLSPPRASTPSQGSLLVEPSPAQTLT